ncbi:MAG TPA: hypothetical protein RMI62_19725, partial [Polyangiaceae bacterium LLY-WYZ-15_(1-7)]|nr:hypothetical protein [Polyangiaceae bacterium LLY-WYZ-15_(1-7)]
LALALLLASAPVAHAYRTAADLPDFGETERVTWRDPLIPMVVHGAAPDGLSELALQQAFTGARTTWNAVGCSSAALLDAGRTPDPAAGADDVNTLHIVHEGWTELGFRPDAAATTDVRYARDESGWFILEADLYLNADLFAWGLAPEDPEVRDLRAVLTHELGHVLGLLHPCEPEGATGAPTCSAEHEGQALHPIYAGYSQRALSQPDVDGVCFLHPLTASECPMSCGPADVCMDGACVPSCPDCGCTDDDECDEGICVAGACQPARSELGDPCTSDDDCTVGLCADEGHCTEACSDEAPCAPGWRCRAGTCEPDGATYGEPCVRGRDCASGLCVTGTPAGDFCTRGCDGRACPPGDACDLVEGRAVCVPAHTGSGCAAGGTSSPSAGLAWMCLALGLARRRWRKR